MSFDEQLDTLARCGLKLDDRLQALRRADSWSRRDPGESDWGRVLVYLGSYDRGTRRCETLWHLDTECIEGDGSYVYVAERMSAMAQGSLPLSDIEDHVDMESGEGWLRFTCQGKEIEIDLEVESDWIDSSVFGHFVKLLAQCDPNRLYIYYDLGGQDCILGCVTRDQYAELLKVIPSVQPLT